MKKHIVPVFILACFILITSCKKNVLKGEGTKGTTTPPVTSFNAIDIDLPLNTAIITQEGSQPGVQFIGYDNVIKHLRTKVENNTLSLTTDLDETWEIDCDDITVQITVPSLTALSLSGSSDAVIHGNMTGPAFKLSISGAAKVVIDNINVDDFSSDVSGAASIEVKGGTVKKASYDINGAGKIKAFPLQSGETITSISGAGKAEVSAQQQLSTEISGAGYVKYKGHPSVTKHISGAGAVTDAN